MNYPNVKSSNDFLRFKLGDGTVAGWGTEDEAYQVVSPVLRKVTVPLVPSMECAKQYGSYFHPLKMMCAGLTEGGKDACQGEIKNLISLLSILVPG